MSLSFLSQTNEFINLRFLEPSVPHFISSHSSMYCTIIVFVSCPSSRFWLPSAFGFRSSCFAIAAIAFPNRVSHREKAFGPHRFFPAETAQASGFVPNRLLLTTPRLHLHIPGIWKAPMKFWSDKVFKTKPNI